MQLVKFDEMKRAINACHDVDEVKDIRDKALAMELYFRQAKDPEPERKACEIRLRGERRAGEILRDMEKAKAPPGPGRGNKTTSNDTTSFYDGKQKTLADLGISRDQSSKWQQLADVPKDRFEAALAGPNKPSTSGILGSKTKQKPMDPHALWLWGRMRDFENDGILDSDPSVLYGEMTEGMQADVRRLAPLIVEWLERLSNGEVS